MARAPIAASRIGLTDGEVANLRAELAGNRRPRVILPGNQLGADARGQVTAVGDPTANGADFISVRVKLHGSVTPSPSARMSSAFQASTPGPPHPRYPRDRRNNRRVQRSIGRGRSRRRRPTGRRGSMPSSRHRPEQSSCRTGLLISIRWSRRLTNPRLTDALSDVAPPPRSP